MMKTFNRGIDERANVRTPISEHSHIREQNRAVSLIERYFQHCAGCAHSSHFSTAGRTLQNSVNVVASLRLHTVNPSGGSYCAVVRIPGVAHSHNTDVCPHIHPHIREYV
jgi:hypothetical protein